MINLLQQFIELEREGIDVTIVYTLMSKKKYELRLSWESPHHWRSGMPSGRTGISVEFESYSELSALFDIAKERMRQKINRFLAGSNI